jgi:hypothetical protein
MSRGIFTLGPHVIIEDHPSIKIEHLRLFQNNNNNILNNQILKPFHDHLSKLLGSSMKGRTKKFVSASHGALEQVARVIHKRPNVKKCIWPPTSDIKRWRLSIFFCA